MKGVELFLESVGNQRMEAHLSRGPNAGCRQHTVELPQITGKPIGQNVVETFCVSPNQDRWVIITGDDNRKIG